MERRPLGRSGRPGRGAGARRDDVRPGRQPRCRRVRPHGPPGARRRRRPRRHRRRLRRRRVRADRRSRARRRPPGPGGDRDQVLLPTAARTRTGAAGPGAGSSGPATSRSAASAPTASTSTSCTGSIRVSTSTSRSARWTTWSRAGKVLAVGTSGVAAHDLVAVPVGGRPMPALTRPVAEQSPYSVFVRGAERALFPACRRHGVGVLVYGPLNGGWLSGKYRAGADPPPGSRAAKRFFDAGWWDRERPEVRRKLALVEPLAALAADCGLSLADLALAFVLAHPAVTCALVGPRTPEQLDSALARRRHPARRRRARRASTRWSRPAPTSTPPTCSSSTARSTSRTDAGSDGSPATGSSGRSTRSIGIDHHWQVPTRP